MNDHFLEPEEKCCYYITADIKKLWKVEIECLQVLQSVCKKYNIRYYAAGGTLLGAVRHKGFIPWDDDIDVFMMEEDYFRFCKIAPREVKEPYFFQSFQTQRGFGPSLSRIRKSNTTGCTEFEYETADEHYNCGIFIDIIPLTSVTSNKFLRFFQNLNILRYRAAIAGYERLRAMNKYSDRKKNTIDPCIFYWRLTSLFMDHEVLSRKFLKACSSGGSQSEYVGVIPFLGIKEKYIYKREWFDETVELPFEYLTLDCPAGYDAILRHQFGDYMIFKKGAAIHTMAVMDPDTPYHEKLYGHKA